MPKRPPPQRPNPRLSDRVLEGGALPRCPACDGDPDAKHDKSLDCIPDCRGCDTGDGPHDPETCEFGYGKPEANIRHVYLWTNGEVGMLMVFDRGGQQVPDYQGACDRERVTKLLADAPATAHWYVGEWRGAVEEVPRGVFKMVAKAIS